ncbi:MAG: hypothetical protein JHC26_02120 [Thermofilum sp.]|jgi:hypothetical protein|uniref:hypothetical protein n=1 Tax=Thermofilum sp. TaxID=1961369 RepID=UPI0025868496|nr:hypothetical protein [Thermofilum sp.]MCI4407860.1 hypothetical protein [Thermofilum sp.]
MPDEAWEVKRDDRIRQMGNWLDKVNTVVWINDKKIYEVYVGKKKRKIDVPREAQELLKYELEGFVPNSFEYLSQMEKKLLAKYPEEKKEKFSITVKDTARIYVNSNFTEYVPELITEVFFDHNPEKKIVETKKGEPRSFRIKELADMLKRASRSTTKKQSTKIRV